MDGLERLKSEEKSKGKAWFKYFGFLYRPKKSQKYEIHFSHSKVNKMS